MMKVSYVFTFLVGWIISVPVYLYWDFESSVPEPTCEYVQKWIWSFQQCLKFQPACQMPKGHEQFMQYHDFQIALVERCENKPGDFLPD